MQEVPQEGYEAPHANWKDLPTTGAKLTKLTPEVRDLQVFDALRASRELDHFLCQFHYDGGKNRAVAPLLGVELRCRAEESLQIKKDDLITDIRQAQQSVAKRLRDTKCVRRKRMYPTGK